MTSSTGAADSQHERGPSGSSSVRTSRSGSTKSGVDSDVTRGSETTVEHVEEKQERSVQVPDLFSSIMAAKPVVNPSYHEVKPKGDAWITKIMKGDEKWHAKNSKVDLCYLASIWAPNCDEVALRMMLDWNHWVFLFDDQFDEGHLSKDSAAAQAEIDRTVAIMEETEERYTPESNPIRYVFQTCWDRLKERSSPALREQWKIMHQRFFDGLVRQVKDIEEGRVFSRDIGDYMAMRRGTIGAYPAICLAEYAQGVDLPMEIVDHPSLQECMCISADLVLLVNDILSYKKDLALGVDHNLITLLMEQGHSTQDAIDQIGLMVDDCYKRWYSALAELPVYGEGTDRQALKFVDCCKYVALGNLHWSFKTGRYVGAEGETVHETRRLSLPE